MAISIFPDGNGSKLGGAGGGGGQGADAGEDASGNELVLDVKDDDLQCPSSFNSASSMGLISGMRNEGSHFGNNYETRDLRNRLPRVASERLASIPVNNSVANRKKGLLSSFYTIAEKLLVFCGSLVIFSLSYPLAANAKETFEDHAMQGVIIGSVISFFISCLLTALGSYLKDSESIDGIGFHIFKWLVLLVFLFLSAGLCVILRFCAHTPKAVLWSLGTVGYIVILSIWVWVFYREVLQIQEEMKRHFEMETRPPSEGPDRVPTLAAPGSPV
ncbi:unnamed protein product [Miscanthus lutarioriparius]|uniref:Uncharacterized protein n=1 Tax=Miscanthus lutarioriparius TaxID=422564 RepID=A0A811QCD7_9POAL|nr:unnamed protein product [Miscanthus lutarioriparius]